MTKRSAPPTRTTRQRRAVSVASAAPVGGLALALSAFEAIDAATTVDPMLRVGRSGLPRTEAEARERALRILEVLEAAGVALPERIAVATLPASSRNPKQGAPAWHAAPIYRVRIGTGPLLEAVADPFLRHAPLSIADWMQQLHTDTLSFLFPDVLLAERDACLTAPDTLKELRVGVVTTQRGGAGTEADSHGLAQLLRAWLRNPEESPAQVQRFRALFGETAWRALIGAYPKLVQQVEAELKRRAPL